MRRYHIPAALKHRVHSKVRCRTSRQYLVHLCFGWHNRDLIYALISLWHGLGYMSEVTWFVTGKRIHCSERLTKESNLVSNSFQSFGDSP